MNDTVAIPPYGVAIRQVLASGSIEDMRRVANDAYTYIGQAEQMKDDLRILEDKLGTLSDNGRAGAADAVPYGDPIRAAIKSGSEEQMRKVAANAHVWLAKAKDVEQSLAELEKALAGLG